MTTTALILFAVAITALVTFRPMNPIGVFLYWFPAWLGQSFAPQLALLSLLLVVGCLAANEGSPQTGLTAVVGVVAAWLFLVVYRRGEATGDSIEPVVEAAPARLGGVDADRVEQDVREKTVFRLTGLRPLHFGRSRVVRTRNVAYGAAGRENCLDIYQPLNKPRQAMPVLIHVPGGGWVSGGKDHQGLPLLYHLAAQGWTCFSINYRLGPVARFPMMLEDVLRAIAWVKTHAGEYGADPGYVAMTGGSSGGHLVSLAALVRDRARLQPGFREFDTRISVAVPIYGRYDFLNRMQLLPGDGLEPFLTAKVMPGPRSSCPELWELASPQSQVHADAPPFFVIHGSGDSMIPVEEARGFVAALRAVSAQAVDYAELPGAQHGFDMVCSSWAMPTIHAISRYLAAHYARHLEDSAQ